MKINVAICTWNRAESLRSSLKGLRRQRSWDGIHVLVVNNNSTDTTSEVIAEFSDGMPVRELRETKQGLSHARNCALESSLDADYLIYTDDDVEVCEGWLSAYCEAFRAFPDAGFFAGPIDAGFCTELPKWIHDNLSKLAGSYGAVDLGGALRIMSASDVSQAPHGGNMAFNMKQIGSQRFDSCLGRTSEQMLLGEETAFVRGMMASGAAGVWIPEARLTHLIPAEHVSAAYVWKRFEGGGRSVARVDGLSSGPYWWGAPRYCWRQYVVSRAKMTLLAPLSSVAWFDAFSKTAYLHGYITEQRIMSACKRVR